MESRYLGAAMAAFLLALVCFAVPVFSQPAAPVVKTPTSVPSTTPATVDDAVQVGKSLIGAIKNKEWRLVVALGLMLLVWAFRYFLFDFVTGKAGKYAPLLIALIGLLANLPFELSKTPFNWPSFLVGGLLTSGTAIALWSTIGKLILPAPTPPSAPTPTPPDKPV